MRSSLTSIMRQTRAPMVGGEVGIEAEPTDDMESGAWFTPMS